MARPVRSFDREVVLLGGSIPFVVLALIVLTIAYSILAAVLAQAGAIALRDASLFIPRDVMAGEIWRAFTWVLLEIRPLNLVFECLGLYWFGSQLARAWGAGRFLGIYAIVALATAGVTTLVSLAWPTVHTLPYWGPFPLIGALIIAWASLFPNRDVLVYFVLPLRGRNLILITLGGTLLFALLDGIHFYVPHFAAQGLVLVWMRGLPFGEWWLRARYAMAERRFRRRTHKFRVVGGRDEPPRWLH